MLFILSYVTMLLLLFLMVKAANNVLSQQVIGCRLPSQTYFLPPAFETSFLFFFILTADLFSPEKIFSRTNILTTTRLVVKIFAVFIPPCWLRVRRM